MAYALFVLLLVMLSGVEAVYNGDCNNPHGRDCTYYRECVEAQIPCQGRSDDYAIAYGEHYCNRLDAASSNFSPLGKQWIDAVRKCLQERLVPIVNQNPPCYTLKRLAIETHVPCYLNPGVDEPSICSLPLPDLIYFIVTYLPTLPTDLKEFIYDGLRTALDCLPFLVRNLLLDRLL